MSRSTITSSTRAAHSREARFSFLCLFSANSVPSVSRSLRSIRALTRWNPLAIAQPTRTLIFLARKCHRIIFFADPHHLTPIESYSYQKQGEGWGIRITHTVPLFSTGSKQSSHSNASNCFSFMRLHHSAVDAWGVGWASQSWLSSARFRGFSPV